jgi:NAD-dependent dihydropyrimidine dehydrogenase PreA subunit
MKRDIIKIDEELCNGCGLCVPNCHEGALQVIDGKVRLISDLMCDGLGACIGHCPEDAITIEHREAVPYDETAVMEEMISKGKNVIIAHLKHLKDHNEIGFFNEGVSYLIKNEDNLNFNLNEILNKIQNKEIMKNHEEEMACGCPGSMERTFDIPAHGSNNFAAAELKSELRQWPVQMHLLNPNAPFFRNSDVVITADCVGFALGNYHQKYLRGKSIGIACPKLDSNTESYIEKFRLMIDEAKVNTITVMIMEVPCCGGLIQMVKSAVDQAERKIPVKLIVVGVQGDILNEEWI